MQSNWDLDFITRDELKKHIKKTMKEYGEILKSINLKKFNSNLIDPIKLTFDSKIYNKEFKQLITEEISRQRDKSNNNAIGYFHQNIFDYIKKCEVQDEGFDVIFETENSKIYIEMKNKHNTMNSSSSQKTYMKMQSLLLREPNAECYLVEVIARRSQNIVWSMQVDKVKYSDERIRRVSIDQFYSKVTNDVNAFKKICDKLPLLIDEILTETPSLSVQVDTVFDEIIELDSNYNRALYKLSFGTYLGFTDEVQG